MSTKITITNIENIDWAKRLIITFYVHESCFDPSAGSWEYIDSACGYRNIIDSDWIQLSPNTQHPLHSSVIKYAGEYRYVWDYGGVYGLDPANFDSSHSYLIEISLVDTSCNYFDPCANSNYLTQYGQEPIGAIDTFGDVNNTYNNCGPNYELKADSNGCLFCQPLNLSGNNIPSHSDGVLVYTHTNISRPFDKPPFNQSSFGISWDLIEDQDALFGKIVPPVENNQEASDTPVGLVIGPGPGSPGPQIDNFYSTRTVFGNKQSPFPNSYDYYKGKVIPDRDEIGPGADISGSLVGHIFGGFSPSINPPTTLNAKVPLLATDYVSEYNASVNSRRSADQLNLNPHQISSQDNISVTSNNTYTPSTKIKNAIVVSDDSVLIRGKDVDNIITTKTTNYSFVSTVSDEIKNKPILNSKESSAGYSTSIGSEPSSLASSIVGSSSFNKSIKRSGDLNLSLVDFSKDSDDFESNYNLSIYVSDKLRLGDKIFMDINLTPKQQLSYNYVIEAYIKYGNRSYLLFNTLPKSRTGSIRIAKLFDFNISPGEATVIVVVKNQDESIVASRKYPIQILDASTNQNKIFSTPLSVDLKSSIEKLINPTHYIKAPIGAPNNYIEYVLNVVPGDSEFINLAVLVTSTDPNIEHAITIYDGSDVYINTGKLKIDGISPQENYSSALYVQVPRSDLGSTLRLRVSNIENKNTYVTIGIGPDLEFNPLVITTYSYNYSNNVYRVTVDSSMLYSTNITLFSSGGDNIVPSYIPTQASVTTSTTGSFQSNVRSSDKGWIGIAYTYPTTVPLAKRIITYIKGMELYS